jgi:hypothetical protein
MIRCQLSSNASTVLYTFPYNPCDYDAKDDYSPNEVQILHGAPAYQPLAFDGRPRVLRWENMSTAAAIETMLATCASRKGKQYYIKFNEMGQLNHSWPSWAGYSTWYKIRIVDVKTKAKKGGALYYEYIELWISPQQ